MLAVQAYIMSKLRQSDTVVLAPRKLNFVTLSQLKHQARAFDYFRIEEHALRAVSDRYSGLHVYWIQDTL
jgi:hypothetical protein